MCKKDGKLRFCRAHLRKTQLVPVATSPHKSAGNRRRRVQPIGGCDGSWEIRERGMPVLLPALFSMSSLSENEVFFMP